MPLRSRLAPIPLILAMLPLVLWGACTARLLRKDDGITAVLIYGALVLSVLGSIVGFANYSWFKSRDPRFFPGRDISFAAGVIGLISPILSAFLALLTVGIDIGVFPSGRALRRGGKARRPTHGVDAGWVEDLGTPLEAPPAVAAAWRANAATEAASVAAFAHLSNELLALGAPAHLIEKAHTDALDEIRHARLCYGVAAAVDGQQLGPASFPAASQPRDGHLDFAALAAECLVESCLLESASARTAAALAAHDAAPGKIRAVLEIIAIDEARHAAHGWEIIAWCRQVGGPDVDAAMRKALTRVAVPATLVPLEYDALECWGIAGPTLWSRCIEEAHAEVEQQLDGASALPLAA